MVTSAAVPAVVGKVKVNGFVFCVGNTLQRLYIGKIGVIYNDTNTFSCVNRRTSAQCDDEVGSGCFESSHNCFVR